MGCNETLKALFYHHVHDADKAVKEGHEGVYKSSVEDMGEMVELSKEFDPELTKEFEKVYKKYDLKPTTAESYRQPNTKNIYKILDKGKHGVHVKIHPKGYYDVGEPTTYFTHEEWKRLQKTLKLHKDPIYPELKKAIKSLVIHGNIALAEELNEALDKPIPISDIQISTDLPTEKVERIKTEFAADAINVKTFAEFQDLISKIVVELQLVEKDREHIATVLNKIRELVELEKI